MVLLAWLIFVPLQLVWLPLSIIGVSWVAYKQIVRSRALGLSQTAIEIVNGRWTAHVFGLRRDRATAKIAGRLPNNSTLGLRVALFPLMIARIIAGKPILYPLLPDDATAGIASMVFSRSMRFDQLIAKHAGTADQFVILGAGLDTRAYGPLAEESLTIFELDQLPDQQAKQQVLKRARIPSDHVHFIEVDFNDPNWIGALTRSTYDPTLKTIFLWEGVTLYLSERNVASTLDLIKKNTSTESVVVLDVYGERFLQIARKGAMAKTLEATGEGIDFGLDLSGDADRVMAEFASKMGYGLGEYFLIGYAHKKGPYMAIAELKANGL